MNFLEFICKEKWSTLCVCENDRKLPKKILIFRGFFVVELLELEVGWIRYRLCKFIGEMRTRGI
jgi:hypothetical protein